MNKSTKIIIGIIVAIIIIYGIWYGASKKPTAPTTKEPIKIGATLPLTGKLSDIGSNVLAGAEIAIKETNAQGGINGRELKLIVYDNQGEPQKAVSDFNMLKNVDGVKIVLSTGSNLISAIAPIVTNDILFAPLLISEGIGVDNPNIFRISYFPSVEAKKLAEILQKRNISKAGILHSNLPSASQFLESFKKSYKGKIIEEAVSPQESDFKASLMKIKKENPQALILPLFPYQLALVLKQMQELNYNVQICTVLSDAINQNLNVNEISKSVLVKNNAIIADHVPEEVKNTQKFKDLQKIVKEQYKVNMTHDFYYAYDAIYILAKAISKCSNPSDLECVKSEMLKNSYDLLIGKNMKFDSNRNLVGPVYFKQLINGKLVEIK
jgi:branched-chain amino acid transport system substrate-binding protein